MSHYNKLCTAVFELTDLGLTPSEIAVKLELADDEVEIILVDGYEPEHDGQPTEMEEWLDFNPDC